MFVFHFLFFFTIKLSFLVFVAVSQTSIVPGTKEWANLPKDKQTIHFSFFLSFSNNSIVFPPESCGRKLVVDGGIHVRLVFGEFLGAESESLVFLQRPQE